MTGITRRAALAGAGVSALMPFVKTAPASAAAPLAEKQTPSFYRYNVGTHQVTVVCDGVATINLPDNYAPNISKEEISKVFAESQLPTDKVTHTFSPVVVNTGSKLVVIDTGLGPDQFAQSKGRTGQFHGNLAAANIDRNAVDTVIISHFHGDHINGLLAAENKPAFANAEIMVPATEWKFWMDDGEMSKGMGNPLVQVDITAGAAFLFVKNPHWNLASDVDKPLAVQTRHKMYDMAIAEKMPIQAFHAAFPGLVRVEKDGNGYRWIPAIWNASL